MLKTPTCIDCHLLILIERIPWHSDHLASLIDLVKTLLLQAVPAANVSRQRVVQHLFDLLLEVRVIFPIRIDWLHRLFSKACERLRTTKIPALFLAIPRRSFFRHTIFR